MLSRRQPAPSAMWGQAGPSGRTRPEREDQALGRGSTGSLARSRSSSEGWTWPTLRMGVMFADGAHGLIPMAPASAPS